MVESPEAMKLAGNEFLRVVDDKTLLFCVYEKRPSFFWGGVSLLAIGAVTIIIFLGNGH
jgi:hypothetical protein